MDKKDRVNVTITMTKTEHKRLRQIALDEDTSVSALVRKWMDEYTDKKDAE